MITPEHESRRAVTGPGFSESVAFAFADPSKGVYGMARLGLGGGRASALAVLMRGRDVAGAVAEGDLPAADELDWAVFEAAGLRATVEEPLTSWTLALERDGYGFDLVFDALAAPGELAAVAGGEGYEQLCRVSGDVRVGGETIAVDGAGQRGHSWGAPEWDAVELTRGVSAWLGDGALGGIALVGARPAGARGHADESVAAVIVERGEPVPVADARLSTAYDGEGRMRRAGLELWVDEDGYPLRAAGEVVCGTSLDLGALRLDLGFLHWHAEGLEGAGRYEILRRT